MEFTFKVEIRILFSIFCLIKTKFLHNVKRKTRYGFFMSLCEALIHDGLSRTKPFPVMIVAFIKNCLLD